MIGGKFNLAQTLSSKKVVSDRNLEVYTLEKDGWSTQGHSGTCAVIIEGSRPPVNSVLLRRMQYLCYHGQRNVQQCVHIVRYSGTTFFLVFFWVFFFSFLSWSSCFSFSRVFEWVNTVEQKEDKKKYVETESA